MAESANAYLLYKDTVLFCVVGDLTIPTTFHFHFTQ